LVVRLNCLAAITAANARKIVSPPSRGAPIGAPTGPPPLPAFSGGGGGACAIIDNALNEISADNAKTLIFIFAVFYFTRKIRQQIYIIKWQFNLLISTAA
jgi:hypothetical protein